MSQRAALIDFCPHCERMIRLRTNEQNGALHAILHDIAEQRDWPRGSGQKLDIETWKRLVTVAFERTRGRKATLYPAVDGGGMDAVYRRTSRMSDIEMNELKHFARATAIELDVELTEPEERMS